MEAWLLAFLTLALNGGDWSASCPRCFIPEIRAPRTQWTGCWVGPRAALEMRKNPSIVPAGN